MKDIFSLPPASPMAKVGVMKKDKASAKKPKESKRGFKIHERIPKISLKKPRNKLKELAKSKPVKKTNALQKNSMKKGAKPRGIKEHKCVLKNPVSDTGKRKVVQRNHVIRNNEDHVIPAKIPKRTSDHCDASKFVNGNGNATTVPQTTRNPWVMKLGIAPEQPKPVVNGVSSNGSAAVCNKPIVFVPKRNALSGLTSKKGQAFSVKTSMQVTKQAVKSCTNFSKEPLKNGNIGRSSLLPVGSFKKNEISKQSGYKSLKPNQKSLCNFNAQKTCGSKVQKLADFKHEKLSSKDKKLQCSDQKSTPFGVRKEKLSVLPKQSEVASKDQKTLTGKYRRTAYKDTKQNSGLGKKSNLQDRKAVVLRDPTKHHPQRMASLDAMAKMHIICSTDRRPSMEVSRLQSARESSSSSQCKTNSQKIHVDIKKETREFKEHIFHSRINCVKVEKSSVSQRTEKVSTYCSISEEQEETVTKRARGRPKSKLKILETLEKAKKSAKFEKSSKLPAKESKKAAATKEKKTAKTQKQNLPGRKAFERERKNVSKIKPDKPGQKVKLEKIKSKLKVKETIRMRKTCTYQSVTTVSSHETVDSVVASCSSVGVTTNYETKKTVVRNEACEKKTDLALEEFQEPFLQALESPCPVAPVSNCRHLLHSSPEAVIPLAHSKPCHGFQGSEKPNSCLLHCCNGGLSVHQCGHQQPFIYHPFSYSCGCCCSSSLLQPVFEPCLIRKGTGPCAHRSHYHLSSPSCSVCTHYHGIPSMENGKHHEQHLNVPSTSSFQNRWCSCHQPCHHSGCHSQVICAQCSSVTAKQCASLVPCDQTPLDLSVGAANSTTIEKSNLQPRTRCPSLHCCQGNTHFQPSSRKCAHNHVCNYAPNNYPPCWNQASDCAERGKSCHTQTFTQQQPPTTDSLLSTVSYSKDDEPCGDTEQDISASQNSSFSDAKQEHSSTLRSSVSKKRKFAHGWSWEGEPTERMIQLTNDAIPTPKKCYPAMRHKEGDIINERDCVLLKSGPKDTDLPYVAKVAAFWENLEDGEMMMSLLWYYRPEHTEQGRKPGQMEDEVFASKHRDVNSVACIEDKCYVLTFNEYCRYRSNLAMIDVCTMFKAACTVPEGVSAYPRRYCLPAECVSPDMIFFCRHVYDFRQKRILKNPA